MAIIYNLRRKRREWEKRKFGQKRTDRKQKSDTRNFGVIRDQCTV